MFGLGGWELLIILVIVLIIFGAGKLPRVASDLAKGIKSFRAGLKEEGAVDEGAVDEGAADEGVAEKEPAQVTKAETVPEKESGAETKSEEEAPKTKPKGHPGSCSPLLVSPRHCREPRCLTSAGPR